MAKHNYQKNTEDAFYGPIKFALDITPTPLDSNGEYTPLNFGRGISQTRAISVSADATVTGIFAENTTEFTTHTLKAGVLYPFVFKAITAISTGTIKGYA